MNKVKIVMLLSYAISISGTSVANPLKETLERAVGDSDVATISMVLEHNLGTLNKEDKQQLLTRAQSVIQEKEKKALKAINIDQTLGAKRMLGGLGLVIVGMLATGSGATLTCNDKHLAAGITTLTSAIASLLAGGTLYIKGLKANEKEHHKILARNELLTATVVKQLVSILPEEEKVALEEKILEPVPPVQPVQPIQPVDIKQEKGA